MIRTVLATLLIVGVAIVAAEEGAAAAPAAGGLFGGRLQNIIEPRMAINVVRMHQLEKQMDDIRERMTEAEKVDPEKFMAEVDARIYSLEEQHCDKKEYQCGESHECVSDLFMCDGKKDCHNGMDEDEDVCDGEPVKVGNVFSGLTHWKDCIQREDHTSTLKIIATKRFKFFPARIGVQAIATAEFKENGEETVKSYSMKGAYNFANRRLVLFPADHDDNEDYHLGLRCNFDRGDNERADCNVMTFTSLHVCADIHFTLEHHE
jgi:hypothetical protein